MQDNCRVRDDMQFAVRLAMESDDLDAVSQQRYQVLVAEMGKRHPPTDSRRRLLPDPLDIHASVLRSEDASSDLVGTICSYAFGTGQDWTAQDELLGHRARSVRCRKQHRERKRMGRLQDQQGDAMAGVGLRLRAVRRHVGGQQAHLSVQRLGCLQGHACVADVNPPI